MRQLILKNSEWYRGKSNSALKIPDKNQFCCLGIYCRDLCDVPKKVLEGLSVPSRVPNLQLDRVEYKRLCQRTFGARLEIVLANINDDQTFISDTVRVERLRPYFEKLDVELIYREDL